MDTIVYLFLKKENGFSISNLQREALAKIAYNLQIKVKKKLEKRKNHKPKFQIFKYRGLFPNHQKQKIPQKIILSTTASREKHIAQTQYMILAMVIIFYPM